ncbi:hypothetical protein FKM82_020131 [Ascaphus truei]
MYSSLISMSWCCMGGLTVKPIVHTTQTVTIFATQRCFVMLATFRSNRHLQGPFPCHTNGQGYFPLINPI